MCTRHFHFTEEEFHTQFEIWLDYVMSHTPPCFPDMAGILHRQKQARWSHMCSISFRPGEHSARLSNSFWPRPDCHLWMGAGTRKGCKPRPLSLGSDYESLQLKSYRAFGGRRYEIRLRYGKNSERPLRLGWMGTSGDTGNFRFYETVLRLFLCNPDRIGANFYFKGECLIP